MSDIKIILTIIFLYVSTDPYQRKSINVQSTPGIVTDYQRNMTRIITECKMIPFLLTDNASLKCNP
ncbi:hypothetical protein ERHA55_53580 (plasmid) [Erwinia rhapontici]|uniref:Uncharacterized protein n=1 Tax=Erwinia rhapontici TaxID=55212 RepID=A0ABM7N7C2_ERWRD|nr:hypothetical protein ERHA53_47210 [Erwinia rhapontici]BCQ47831.1 hypothetical protein ERHA55_53580 [Erwinia rhapontici]